MLSCPVLCCFLLFAHGNLGTASGWHLCHESACAGSMTFIYSGLVLKYDFNSFCSFVGAFEVRSLLWRCTLFESHRPWLISGHLGFAKPGLYVLLLALSVSLTSNLSSVLGTSNLKPLIWSCMVWLNRCISEVIYGHICFLCCVFKILLNDRTWDFWYPRIDWVFSPIFSSTKYDEIRYAVVSCVTRDKFPEFIHCWRCAFRTRDTPGGYHMVVHGCAILFAVHSYHICFQACLCYSICLALL